MNGCVPNDSQPVYNTVVLQLVSLRGVLIFRRVRGKMLLDSSCLMIQDFWGKTLCNMLSQLSQNQFSKSFN